MIDPSWDDGILMMQNGLAANPRFVSHLLETEYREVYNRGGYRVLVRHPRGSAHHETHRSGADL